MNGVIALLSLLLWVGAVLLLARPAFVSYGVGAFESHWLLVASYSSLHLWYRVGWDMMSEPTVVGYDMEWESNKPVRVE